MNRSADPASIPDDQFHLLANVRLTPAGMTDRPGLLPSFHTSDQGAGCITGMIEVEEIGVGLLLTPSFADGATYGHSGSTIFPGNMQLAVFNEYKAPGTVSYDAYADREDQRGDFRRYNDELLLDAPKKPGDATFASVTYPMPRSGSVIDYPFVGTLTSAIKYRKRILQFGTRERPQDDDEDDVRTWACLWEVKLPEEETFIVADYQLYQDLWEIVDSTYQVSDAVTVFGRDDDPQSNEERIAEILYIGRMDGTVWSFDGTTLQQGVSMGADYIPRLSVFNGVGVLAIGANATPTASAARFLDAPGGTWSTITIPGSPDILLPTDLISYGGAIYITCDVVSGNPDTWAGCRVYKFDGATIASVFEFIPDAPLLLEVTELGLLFAHRGQLYVLFLGASGSNQDAWHVYQRVADNNWVRMDEDVNSKNGGDFPDTRMDWVLTTADRVLVGGVWYDEATADQYAHEINELTDWKPSDGPLLSNLYYNTIPLEEGPTVGFQALLVAPEDVALNAEEL